MNKKYQKVKEIKKEKQSHYTDVKMVIDLLDISPIDINDSVLDVGSGRNKVWFNNLKNKDKYECEIEDGNDFMDWNKNVDWVIGNPPYHMFVDFLFKSIDIADKGIRFLISSDKIIHLTTRRLEKIKEKGFFLNKIHVVNDKRWFGRYYYIIFTKKDKGFLTWSNNKYGECLKGKLVAPGEKE